MAGHSKWANIKARKEGQDSRRGALFTKLIREITVSARLHGEDVSANPRLRTAVEKALSQNMRRDTIQHAIQRGIGGLEGSHYVECRYEGYGPGGVAVLVHCLTDNKNRTVSEVRHAFTKAGGQLGSEGSVAYLFEQKGQFLLPSSCSEQALVELALEAGAEDVITLPDGSFEILTSLPAYGRVKQALSEHQIIPEQTELGMLATRQTVITDLEEAKTLLKLTDTLDALDDVQHVYTNADFDSDILDRLQA